MLLEINILRVAPSEQQILYCHAFFTRQLHLVNIDHTIPTSHTELRATIGNGLADITLSCILLEVYRKEFCRADLLATLIYRCPGTGIGREPAYEVYYILATPRPIDATILLKYFGCRLKSVLVDMHLLNRRIVTLGKLINRI